VDLRKFQNFLRSVSGLHRSQAHTLYPHTVAEIIATQGAGYCDGRWDGGCTSDMSDRLLTIFLWAVSASSAATWSEANTGLTRTVPGVVTLTVDPISPSTLYARTTEGSVFKSRDGAVSWRRLGGISGVAAWAVDPKTPSTIYATTNRGFILKSTNGGENWIGAGSGLVAPFGALSVDPVNPSTLYVTSYLNGVFKSTDAGVSWRALHGSPINTSEIFVDPSNPSTIYAPSGSGLYRSTDGGEAWSEMEAGFPAGTPIAAFAIAPQDPSTMYLAYVDRAARSAVVIKTIDGGRNWSAINTGLPSRAAVRSVMIHPRLPVTVYIVFQVNTGVGFLQSTDGGASWNAIDEGLPAGTTLIRSLALDQAEPSTIYAAYYDARAIGGGVLKRTSRGAGWTRADFGLTEVNIRTLATDPANASILYAGGLGGLFRSLDSGTSWTNLIQFQLPDPTWIPPLPQPPPFGAGPAYTRSLVINPANPNVIYALTWRYNACASPDKLVFKSVDGGATWSDGASPPFSGCRLNEPMVLDPGDPDTIYLAEAEDGAWLRMSRDGGTNWSTVWDWTRGMESHLNALAIDPANSATLYAGISDVSQFLEGSTASGLMKSTDGGARWNNIGLTGSAVTVLLIDPNNTSILYASTEGLLSEPRGFRGLFKSTDSGSNWFAVSNGLESLMDSRFRITAIVIDRDNPGLLYLGSAGGGVFKSLDGGESWQPLNHCLPDRDIRALALAPGGSRTLFVGTPSGVFKLIDEEAF